MFQTLSIWFAYPGLLGFIALLLVLALLYAYARKRRRQALALLGQSGALQKLLLVPSGPRYWRTVCLFVALTLMIVGAAGPRWGRVSIPVDQGSDRDLVLVLDLSRSMLAEQPSRQELARRALRDLANTMTEKVGPRIALVVFAAHAQLAFPLTSDYDHLLDALTRYDADDLPPSLRAHGDDGSVSGTRIGEALRLALHALDPKVGGDILLLSDGDDPAGDDEWLEGAEEARRHHVPVHTIGIGNPGEGGTIPLGSSVYEYAGQQVKTRLNEKVLQEIARRTGGNYVPAHTTKLPLGKLLPSILLTENNKKSGNRSDSDSTLPVLNPRYAWFLGPALFFLMLTLFERTGRPPQPMLAKLACLPLLVALVSAAPLTDVNGLLLRGKQAFERGQNEEALRLFEEAETFAPDPSLVAFNQAAVLYHLQRFEEAAQYYQRCLEDNAISPNRRSRAFFQMGNSLLRASQGVNRGLLENALDAYRSCLLMDETKGDLREDARHNLELARLLWLKTQPIPTDPPENGDQPPKNNQHKKPENKKDNGKNGQYESKTDEPGSNDNVSSGKGENPNSKSKKAFTGPLTVLPDRDELVPLTPQETQAHLEQVNQRILNERHHYRRGAVSVPENVKDW